MTCHASSATFPPEQVLILESCVSREDLVWKPSKEKFTLQLVETDQALVNAISFRYFKAKQIFWASICLSVAHISRLLR
ncbi:MAG TPA: hypothetical protein DIU35_02710 [Candidatus Latescibacteria bacterium]|nr:hypothetical protein [Candidatus Latescibacterota bacterium]